MEHHRAATNRGPAMFGFAGFVAAAVLFAGAHLLSAFFSASSSPLTAMGSAFIDMTPPWLKDTVIAWFGTNDKLVLYLSLGVVAAVVAVFVGILARSSQASAIACIVALGIAMGWAVLSRAESGPADVVPVVVGTVLSLLVLKWLVRKATVATEAAADDPTRRAFLRGSLLMVVAAGVAAGAGQALSATRNATKALRQALQLPAAKSPVKPLDPGTQVDVAGLEPFITPNEDFYRIDTALSVPRVDPAQWSLRVHGMVEHEFTMNFDELLAADLVESYLTLTCVSNPVGGPLVGTAKWLGYPLALLLERAGPTAGADMVFSTSSDGFTASTPLEVLTDGRMALLAVGMNGEPLPLQHGFPVRMVVPGLYGYVSATKWVVDIEVTRFADNVAYWSTRGWSDDGPIKLASRVDVPREQAKVPAGEVVMGGTAWAQTRGISKVQVQIDDGEWVDAELGAEASVDTWRQWRYLWEGAPGGNHSVTVRAVDGNGEVQTAEHAPPAPDGSSGWHRVDFTVQ